MPKFLVSVSRMETYAEIEVEAANIEDAKERALSWDELNTAHWQVSDGNFVRRDDCDVYAVEEIDPDDAPQPDTAAPAIPLKALAWMIRDQVEQSTARLPDMDAADALAELADVDSIVAWMIEQGAEAAALTECLPNDEEREELKARAKAETRLRATFFDAQGVEVETVEGSPQEVADKAARFMVLHGSDPDEDGAAAQPGRVAFFPA